MSRMSSREFSEWIAYERVNGTVGAEWDQETEVRILEQLHTLTYLFSQANFTDKNHRKGPVPPPERIPRPWELYKSPDRIDAEAERAEKLKEIEELREANMKRHRETMEKQREEFHKQREER